MSFPAPTVVSNSGLEVFTELSSGSMLPVTEDGLYRVSLFLSVPLTATGQYAGLQAYVSDANQDKSQFVYCNFCAPGQTSSSTRVVNATAGQTLGFGLYLENGTTFVSTGTIAYYVEKL